MSLENRIAQLLEQTRAAKLDEALGPGAGVKEDEPSLQGSSQRASFSQMSAGNAKSGGSAGRLAPGVAAKENEPKPQGDSKKPGWESLEGDPGKKAAAAQSETKNKPTGKGADMSAGNFKTVADPTSEVNKPTSRGNILHVGESVQKLFADEQTLSEEFKEKATNLFTALVEAKIAELREALEAEVSEAAVNEIIAAEEDLVGNVDKYLTYIAEQWIESNEAQVTNALKVEMAESFFAGLRELYETHYITLPEEGVDVVVDLTAQVADLKAQLDAKIEEAVTTTESVTTLKRDQIVADVAKGLALTESEKLATLCADLEFVTEEKFTEKVKVIRENYFPKAPKAEPKTDDTAEVTGGEPETGELTPEMARYVAAVNKVPLF